MIFQNLDLRYLPLGIERQNLIVCGVYARKTEGLTSVPEDTIQFFTNREGLLKYGATGFMLMNFSIVDKVGRDIGGVCQVSKNKFAVPFFYERIVSDAEMGKDNLWLSEDYSFCWSVRKLGGRIYGYISPTIGHIIPTEKFVTTLNEGKTWPEKSVVYYCGHTAEKWSPKNLEKGLGGSELAVITLTKYWVRNGYNVTVYCNCNGVGNYEGVEYKEYKDFNFMDNFDILILWRELNTPTEIKFKARKVYVDLHDIMYPKQITPKFVNNITAVCVKSKYHATFLGTNISEEKIRVISNGGTLEKPENVFACKDPNYLIYASSYDRGIEGMLKWGWPIIKRKCPNAYLKIFYGWEMFDLLNLKSEKNLSFKERVCNLMKQDGVMECGRMPHDKLLKEKEKASVHYYVGGWPEIDCITIRESASLGTIPVVADYQVFKEKDYCVKVGEDPLTEDTHVKAAEKVVEVMENLEKYRSLIQPPESETWENVAKKWIELF